LYYQLQQQLLPHSCGYVRRVARLPQRGARTKHWILALLINDHNKNMIFSNRNVWLSILALGVALCVLGGVMLLVPRQLEHPAAVVAPAAVVVLPATLLGSITNISGSELTIKPVGPNLPATATVAFDASTTIQKQVPDDAQTLQKKLKEFLAAKAKAGSAFVLPPPGGTLVTLSSSDLAQGLAVSINLAPAKPGQTPRAESIFVLPSLPPQVISQPASAVAPAPFPGTTSTTTALTKP
jgi:hypothetical protein